ncbi:MAG: hypothetical protein ABSB09_16150 [Acidimicrobiales bacterium]|jgi:membrane protein implicated in regulation of membrane protease activity
MTMPGYLVVLGVLALVNVAMGVISVVTGSWPWSAATVSSIVLWFVGARVVPNWTHRRKGTLRH